MNYVRFVDFVRFVLQLTAFAGVLAFMNLNCWAIHDRD